ncbi:hypothetical protein Tco_1439038 [Tanacetum coccineum]
MAYPCLHFTRNHEELKINTPYPVDINTPLDINALALSDRHPTYHETPSDQDEYSKIISEKHVENEENTEIDENGSKRFEFSKKGKHDDLKKKMEDDRVAAEAHRVVDQLALHKTLNDRLESFAKNYPPRAIELDRGPS